MTEKKKHTPESLMKKIEELEKKIDELQTNVNDKEEHLLRALADLQNIRRRADEDRIRLAKYGAERMLLSILPTLDHLELAIKNAPKKDDEFTRGVRATFSGLVSALESQDVARIDQIGTVVDPAIHEVISIDENINKDEVCEIYQTGYRLGNKVVRAAKVKAGGKK